MDKSERIPQLGGGLRQVITSRQQGASEKRASYDPALPAKLSWGQITANVCTSTGVTSTGVTSAGVSSTGVTSAGVSSAGVTSTGVISASGSI